MKVLLDTNVLSEPTRPRPDRRVLAWLHEFDEDRVFLSAISLAEIRRGIVLMDDGKRRHALDEWLTHDFASRFAGRIVSVDQSVALAWGDIMGTANRQGLNPGTMDCFIAATAKAHGLILATRNTRDFSSLGIKVVNPWKD